MFKGVCLIIHPNNCYRLTTFYEAGSKAKSKEFFLHFELERARSSKTLRVCAFSNTLCALLLLAVASIVSCSADVGVVGCDSLIVSS